MAANDARPKTPLIWKEPAMKQQGLMSALGLVAAAEKGPRVVGVVCFPAFAAVQDECMSNVIQETATGAPVTAFLTLQGGWLCFAKATVTASFSADIDAPPVRFIAQSQMPCAL